MWSSQTQSLTLRECLHHPQVLGSEQKDQVRGNSLGEVGSGAIPALLSVADIDECANETLCGSHGFCENSDGSFRCLCDRGYESSPSGHYCVGKSPMITLPVSEGQPLMDARLVSLLTPRTWTVTASLHGEYQAWTEQLMEKNALP